MLARVLFRLGFKREKSKPSKIYARICKWITSKYFFIVLVYFQYCLYYSALYRCHSSGDNNNMSCPCEIRLPADVTEIIYRRFDVYNNII